MTIFSTVCWTVFGIHSDAVDNHLSLCTQESLTQRKEFPVHNFRDFKLSGGLVPPSGAYQPKQSLSRLGVGSFACKSLKFNSLHD